MAKKKGFFGTLGSLVKVVGVVLAGILVFAIWQNFNSPPDVVAEVPAASVPDSGDGEIVVIDTPEVEINVEETTQELAETATEQADAAADVVSEKVAEAQDAVQEGVAAVAGVVEEKMTRAEDVVASAAELASGAGEQAENAVAALASEADQAVDEVKDKARAALDGLLKPEASEASSTAPITVPGDDTVYAMLEATRAEDGAIEVISQKTGDDTTLTLSRVICAPLSLGVMAAGATREALETRGTPDMERLVLGTPEAALAAYACGVVG